MTAYVACLIVLVALWPPQQAQRLSSVLSMDPTDNSKPEFSCPTNEEYYKCTQIHCYKRCKHLTTPPACPSVSPDCYNPACECIEDYLRNDDGICVPFRKCENWSPHITEIYN